MAESELMSEPTAFNGGIHRSTMVNLPHPLSLAARRVKKAYMFHLSSFYTVLCQPTSNCETVQQRPIKRLSVVES